jgi:hypothetical protein
MDNNMIKTIILIFIAAMVYFLLQKMFTTSVKENYENMKPLTVYGATSNAGNYVNKMTTYNTQLKNALLIPSYRKQYEKAAQTLEEILGYLMVEVMLSIDTKNMTQQQIIDELNKVNILADAQHNLVNSVLPFIDSQ